MKSEKVKFVFVLVKSYSISPARLQRIMEKAWFLLFLKVSIDQLFDNLESGKEILIFVFEKKFWIQKSVQTLHKHGNCCYVA